MNVYEKFVGVMSPYLNRELCFSFLMLALFIVLSLGFKVFTYFGKKSYVIKPIHVFFAGTGIAVGSIFWQIYSYVPGWHIRIIDSVVSTIKSFGFDHTSTRFIEMLYFDEAAGVWTAEIARWSRGYVSFVSLFMIFVTAFAALSIFRDTVAQLKYFVFFWGKAHVFSELNEKSICLARDIRKNERFSRIVFTGVDRIGSEEAFQGLIFEAEKINAIMTRKSVIDFHCGIHRKINIYLIDNEETNNVKNGIEIYKKYYKRDCSIHVFSTFTSAEKFIDDVEKTNKTKAYLNLVNRASIIAEDLLVRYPMYRAADRFAAESPGKKPLMSVLVIGAGTIGMEFAKAAMWCGKMNNYDFKIRILDSSDKENEFYAKYPSFDSELKVAGVSVDYKFDVLDFNSVEFVRKLGIYSDANYIVVATGNDELNLNIASKIRNFFIRKAVGTSRGYVPNEEPLIIPIISNPDYYHILKSKAEDYNSESFCPYGSHFNIYSYNSVNEPPIDFLAKKIMASYNGKPKADKIKIGILRDFLCNKQITKDYNKLDQTYKRSNRANAVHIIYKFRNAGIELCRESDKKTSEKLTDRGFVKLDKREDILKVFRLDNGNGITREEELVALEHDRWSVFNILDGWTSWTVDEILRTNKKPDEKGRFEHKLSAALFHGSLVPFSELPGLGKKLKKNEDHFIKYDRDLTVIAEKEFVNYVDKILEEHKINRKKNDTLQVYINKHDYKKLIKNNKNK